MAQRINYSYVISQANDIQNLSGDLSYEINKLETILSQIKTNWYGPASEEYQRQLLRLINDMKSTKNDMSSLSSRIKDAALNIRNEDEKLS